VKRLISRLLSSCANSPKRGTSLAGKHRSRLQIENLEDRQLQSAPATHWVIEQQPGNIAAGSPIPLQISLFGRPTTKENPMNPLRKSETQGRCGWFKAWRNKRDRLNEKRTTFRPRLESLENRELLSATGLDPVPMQAGLQNIGQVSQAHEATIIHSADVSVAGSNADRSAGIGTTLGSAPSGFTPDQIRHAYNFDQIYFNNGTIAGDGSGQTIAIIEPSVDPNIVSDASQFNATFNLPQFNSPGGPILQVSSLIDTSTGRTSQVDLSGRGELETALDVEWAHAIAPQANILLVYAPVQLNSNGSWNDSTPLFESAQWSANQYGVSVVSMSFGGEFSGEAANDSYFLTPQGHNGVTFVASSGDNGYFIYPASSPNVLAVGGTYLTADSAGNYVSETVWNDSSGSSGGGRDPSYSSANFYPKSGPDVAYNAVGFSVYDSYSGSNWISVNGTSAGAPQWAALIAIANQGRALNGLSSLDGASQTLPMLYNLSSADFHSNITGSNQNGLSGSAVIGLGTPYANLVVADLSGQPISSQPPTQQPPTQQPPTQQPPTQHPPSSAPSPYYELAADALFLVESYEFGDIGGIYAALMNYESILFRSNGYSPQALEQAFIGDIIRDLY
jgi:hypothetical protein